MRPFSPTTQTSSAPISRYRRRFRETQGLSRQVESKRNFDHEERAHGHDGTEDGTNRRTVLLLNLLSEIAFDRFQLRLGGDFFFEPIEAGMGLTGDLENRKRAPTLPSLPL